MNKTKLTGAEPFACSIGELMDLEFADEDFVIQDIVPHHGRVMLFGDTGAAKTQLGLTVAINTIRGEPFLEKYPCTKGKVVYIAVGDMPAAELKLKVTRLREELTEAEKELIHIIYLPDGINILEEVNKSKSWLRDEIRNFNPILVIIDVVSQTYDNTHENDPGYAGPVYTAWRNICVCKAAPAQWFIHHEKKPPQDMKNFNRKYAFSGHLQWISLTSTSMCIIKKENSEEREFQIVKPRNIAIPPPIALVLDEDTLLCYPISSNIVKNWVERQMRNKMPREEIISQVTNPMVWKVAKLPARSTYLGWLEGYDL